MSVRLDKSRGQQRRTAFGGERDAQKHRKTIKPMLDGAITGLKLTRTVANVRSAGEPRRHGTLHDAHWQIARRLGGLECAERGASCAAVGGGGGDGSGL